MRATPANSGGSSGTPCQKGSGVAVTVGGRVRALGPVAALVTGAIVWGTIWYPYRVLAAWGIGGVWGTTLTYLVALLAGAVVFRKALRQARWGWALVGIALASGVCNAGYVLATIHGNVMRVLLLFYLAPLWTILLSRVLLGERLNRAGWGIVALSLSGAATMLWRPEYGAPFPAAGAEWLGMLAGFSFALANVLIRRAHGHSIEVKSQVVFAGGVLVGCSLLLAGAEPWTGLVAPSPWWPLALLVVVGLVLLVINPVVQFGLMGVPANRAIVILLSELVFAALSSWWLAGEWMGLREWLGGALIAMASLLSARMEAVPDTRAPASGTA